MADRNVPYGAFNFLVSFDGAREPSAASPTSRASAPRSPSPSTATATRRRTTCARSRACTRSATSRSSAASSTRKSLFDWIKETRTTGVNAKKQSVTITLHDEAQHRSSRWMLAQRGPDEIHRADAGGKGRRRRGDGRARARRPRAWYREVRGRMPLEFDTARVSVRRGTAAHRHRLLRRLRRTRNARRCPAGARGAARRRLDRRAVGRSEAQVRTLEQLPVVVESWDGFDSLFDWRSSARGGRQRGDLRLLSRRGGAAVLRPGRTAGDHRARRRPLALHGRGRDREPRTARHASRRWCRRSSFRRCLFDPTDPRTWRGIQHLYGLPEASLVCCPISPTRAAAIRRRPTRRCRWCRSAKASSSAATRKRFRPTISPCVASPRRARMRTARGLDQRARGRARLPGRLPARRRPDRRPAADGERRGPAANRSRILEQQNVLVADGLSTRSRQQRLRPARLPVALDTRPPPTFRSSSSRRMACSPGLIAAGALARGTFRSVAGTLLPAVVDTEPVASWGLGSDIPAAAAGRTDLPGRAAARRMGAAVRRHDVARTRRGAPVACRA